MLDDRELLHVRLDFGGDDFGEGEAAPLEAYDGVPLAAVRAALDAYGGVLERAAPGATHAELLAACAAERPLPQALAAVDLALWDRAGRRTGFPVAEADRRGRGARGPGQRRRRRGGPRRRRRGRRSAAAEAGFRCLKLKVGVGDDAGRLAAVRAAAGDAVALRVDANGAWATADEALANLRALAPVGIEVCEEPVHGLEVMRAVRTRSPVPVAMDETAAERGAPGSGAADAVCLKVSRCGGISGLLRDARAARAAGAKVYVASTFDGPLGVAAGLHAAAGLRASGPVGFCGLASLGWFEGFGDVLAPVEGVDCGPRGAGVARGNVNGGWVGSPFPLPLLILLQHPTPIPLPWLGPAAAAARSFDDDEGIPKGGRQLGFVLPCTAHRWKSRWLAASEPERRSGCWALDRSSRPLRSPRRTTVEAEQRVLAERERTGWGPRLLARRPACRIRRCTRSSALRPLTRATDAAQAFRRYQWPCPGDLLHMDIKRYRRFRRPGHPFINDERRPAKRSPPSSLRLLPRDRRHHRRLAYAELLADTRAATVTAFTSRALAWFAARGIEVQRVMTDGPRATPTTAACERC